LATAVHSFVKAVFLPLLKQEVNTVHHQNNQIILYYIPKTTCFQVFKKRSALKNLHKTVFYHRFICKTKLASRAAVIQLRMLGKHPNPLEHIAGDVG
jgi:hypothetical protein